MTDEWKKEIFRFENLSQVFFYSIANFPRPVSSWVVSAITVIFVCFFFYLGANELSVEESAEIIRGFAEYGFSFATAILGFLLAGFSIFATLGDHETQKTMAMVKYKQNGKKTKISILEYIYFNFLNVIFIYIVIVSFSAIVLFIFHERSLFSELLADASGMSDVGLNLVNLFWAGIYLFLVSEGVMRLKSFVWSLYQSILLALTTRAEIEEKAARD